MKINLYALQGPSGLYSFAISPTSDAGDIVDAIINSLKDLLEVVDVSNRDEIVSYCDLLLSSDVVHVMDFNTDVKLDDNKIMFNLVNNDIILALINDIKNKEVL